MTLSEFMFNSTATDLDGGFATKSHFVVVALISTWWPMNDKFVAVFIMSQVKPKAFAQN